MAAFILVAIILGIAGRPAASLRSHRQVRTNVISGEHSDRGNSSESLVGEISTSTAWNWNSREYDCDWDGKRDCGYFDWRHSRCSNFPKCGHVFKPGDHLMEHSCRCMRCYDKPKTAAAKVPMSKAMNKFYYGRWRPWNRVVQTCATWLMPKSDADLRAIIRYAKANKYIVRPAGATHSAGAIVTDWKNNRNTLTVSLAEYVAPKGWNYLFKKDSVSATVWVNAGWSPLQLYSKIRPMNYFLPTQTAGPVFQLGGLISNCVHGGNYQKGFLHQYVVGVRVMLANGTSMVFKSYKNLRYWRNSYGLLGFVTSIKFRLNYRPRFQAQFVKREVNWNEQDFWSFIKKDAHADLPNSVIRAGKSGDRKALMGQFFFNPYEAVEKGKATIGAVVWRANENATVAGVPTKAAAHVHTAYRSEMTNRIIDEVLKDHPQNGKPKVHVYSDYNVAIRHWGGPKVFPLGYSVNDGLAKNARMMTSMALTGPSMLINGNRLSMNDGFYASKCPNVVYAAFFMKPKHVWKAMNILVDNYKKRSKDSIFQWNAPPELRFLKVENDAVLNPVPKGTWAVSEYMGFPIGNSDQGWKTAFKEVEDAWLKLGAKPHIGKFFAFARTRNGRVEPFQPGKACKVYSNAQKKSFEAYRRMMDPNGLFKGGDGLKLLAPCRSSSSRRRRTSKR